MNPLHFARSPGLKAAVLCLAATFLITSQCPADFWGEVLKGRVPKGSDVAWEVAQQLVKRKPRVTSSIADAATDVWMLDGFSPADVPVQMSKLPIGTGGSFVLDQPGFFSLKANAYSVSPGLSESYPSDGYVYAPLHGPCSDVARKIVKKYGGDPNTAREKIQRLLWGISSLSNLGDLAPDIRSMAYDCLSEQECKLVDSTGLGSVYDLVKNISSIEGSPIDFFDPSSQVVDKLSENARSVLQAEWRLREMLKDAGATYSALEAEAIRPGRLKAEFASREIPVGRWSYHPNGYFIRYMPADYTTVRVQVSLPGFCTVERDSLGRITKIAGDSGDRIDIGYDDQAETAADESGVKAYGFAHAAFVRTLPLSPDLVVTQEMKVEGNGFAIVGMPSKKKCDKWSPGKVTGLADRYHLAYESRESIESVLKGASGLRPSGRQPAPSGSEQELVDLAGCILGLKSMIADSSAARDTWAADHLSLAYEAWEDAFCKLAGDRHGSSARTEFDPSDGVAVPGDGASQCLMVSSAPASPRFPLPAGIPEWALSMMMAEPEDRENDCKTANLCLEALKSVRQAFADTEPAKGEDSAAYIKRMETKIEESQGFSDCRFAASFGIVSEDCAPPIGDFGNGKPDIFLTAGKAHAKCHEETCRTVRLQGGTLADWLKNAKNYQQAEIKALDAQIAEFDNWCLMRGCAGFLQEDDSDS